MRLDIPKTSAKEMTKPPQLEMTITSAYENAVQLEMTKTSVKEMIKPPQRGCPRKWG